MKTPASLVIAGLCSLLVVNASAQSPAAEPAAPTPESPALAADKAAKEAAKAHIRPAADRFIMAVPPPPARTEAKTPPPVGNFVWVPGHWAPKDGEWQWVAGTWGIPATPASVWIDAKYDAKTKRWSPGYWQPDRPYAPEPDSPPKDPPAPAKF